VYPPVGARMAPPGFGDDQEINPGTMRHRRTMRPEVSRSLPLPALPSGLAYPHAGNCAGRGNPGGRRWRSMLLIPRAPGSGSVGSA
jgi:hypothetical protein